MPFRAHKTLTPEMGSEFCAIKAMSDHLLLTTVRARGPMVRYPGTQAQWGGLPERPGALASPDHKKGGEIHEDAGRASAHLVLTPVGARGAGA